MASLIDRYRSLVITPQRILCSCSGKVFLQDMHLPSHELRDYRHPQLSRRSDLSERELEAVGIYSLGKTMEQCLGNSDVSNALRQLLAGMTQSDVSSSVTLFELLQEVTDRWRVMVGSAPISRFVAQLARIETASHQLYPSQSRFMVDECIAKGEQVGTRILE